MEYLRQHMNHIRQKVIKLDNDRQFNQETADYRFQRELLEVEYDLFKVSTKYI